MGTTASGMTEDRAHKGEFQVVIFFFSQLQAICVLKKLIGSNISMDWEIGNIHLLPSLSLAIFRSSKLHNTLMILEKTSAKSKDSLANDSIHLTRPNTRGRVTFCDDCTPWRAKYLVRLLSFLSKKLKRVSKKRVLLTFFASSS